MVEDKVVLITGGSRGIGSEMVRVFAENGAKVAFTYRSSAKKANELVAALGDDKVKAYQSDAADFDQAKQLVDQVVEDLGTIDVLVNNAGITKDNLIIRMSEEEWDMVIETNLKSVFNLSKHAARVMMRKRDGVIINIGSVVGIFGNAGQTNYSASKAGIIGFSKSMAKELGSRNVRCNVVAPGFIETEMTEALTDEQRDQYLQVIPLKRLGKGREVADTCLFLSSSMGEYITGQVISVCGGMNM
ncbi:MAG TPA: 3-oxoacyl-[acyl-carrier-protein] reductase [Saprospiraceae bacterium]|nr:3-oxoacyl-[acyl-carrier-protein] reductase [Saprospiraceae bacterium]